MKKLAKALMSLNSTNRESQMYYKAYLRELGKLGQRLHKLKPDKDLKEFLLRINNKLYGKAKK